MTTVRPSLLVASAGVVLGSTGLTTWATLIALAVAVLAVVVFWQLVRFKQALNGLEQSLEDQAKKIAKLQRVAGITPDER